jgi:hypothetical protein
MEGSASEVYLREVRALERSVNWLLVLEGGAWGLDWGGCEGRDFLLGRLLLLLSGASLCVVVKGALLKLSSWETWTTLLDVASSSDPSSSPPRPKGAGFRSVGAGLVGPAFFSPKEKAGLLIVMV